MTSATTGSSYLVHTISQKIRWQIISYLERFVTVYSKVRYFQWYFTGQGPGWPEPGLAGGWWLLGDLSIFHLGQGGSHFIGIVGAYHLSQLLPRSQTPQYTIQISRYYFYVLLLLICCSIWIFSFALLLVTWTILTYCRKQRGIFIFFDTPLRPHQSLTTKLSFMR